MGRGKGLSLLVGPDTWSIVNVSRGTSSILLIMTLSVRSGSSMLSPCLLGSLTLASLNSMSLDALALLGSRPPSMQSRAISCISDSSLRVPKVEALVYSSRNLGDAFVQFQKVCLDGITLEAMSCLIVPPERRASRMVVCLDSVSLLGRGMRYTFRLCCLQVKARSTSMILTTG